MGPYEPRPICAKAHWVPGPWAPGPSLLGEHLTKKRTLEKRVQIVFFNCFLEAKKMRNVRTIILAAVSRRDLCYVSENKGFRFVKNKLIHADPTFIARRSRAHFCFMKFIPINVLVPSVLGIVGQNNQCHSRRGLICHWKISTSQCEEVGTCLLYTSPSPRDKRQSRMPSSA